ncbi:MAG: hypothetical protein MRY83_01310 [Flavobacteriales bacterium]|nr:hypothetical protein [Flavobacteriales bacterium]
METWNHYLKDQLENITTESKDVFIDLSEHLFDTENPHLDLSKIKSKYGDEQIQTLKTQGLNFTMSYIKESLNDGHLSEREINNVGKLKRFFKIKEGELLKLFRSDIRQTIFDHIERINLNPDWGDDITWVDFEEVFDLGYDQLQDIFKKYK